MLFPIGDDQIRGGYFPIFSYSFIVLNIAIYLVQIQFESGLACTYGAIPDEIRAGKDVINLITSQFLHGSWMHLFGNMLFLWVFADNIEATVGNFRFLLFYLLGGVAAALTHIYLNGTQAAACCDACSLFQCGDIPICRGSIPMIGASGAIAAVMGAYLVMHPRSRVKVFFFFLFFQVPAVLFLLFWIGQQFFSGLNTLNGAGNDGIAWWAHIGGFVFGALAGAYFRPHRPWRRGELDRGVEE